MTTRIINKIKETHNSTWVQLRTITKNPTLTQNNVSQMLITLKRAHCFPLARGLAKKGTAAEVCREVVLCSDCPPLCHVEPCCASAATSPLPGLQKKVILLKDTSYLGGCPLGPLNLRGGGYGDGVDRGGGSF